MAGFLRCQEADQVADCAVAVLWVSKRQLVVDFVVAPASAASFRQVAGLLELVDDLRGGAFGDADGDGDVPEADVGIVGDAGEHVSVVRDEPEVMITFSRT